METVEISDRNDFALWAIQRAQEIVTGEGAFAIAAQGADEEALSQTAAALGQAISDAMLEVFDGLVAS
ncbi:hypothetical protein BTE77_26565 [Ensifer adhaerens]|nr:hypothetical protein BTE77_26565 [Ensifer adhaerens]